MFSISEVTGIRYDPEDVVYFANAKQSAAYMLWGASLIDVFARSDRTIVFVFSKSDHEKYRDKWNNHEV